MTKNKFRSRLVTAFAVSVFALGLGSATAPSAFASSGTPHAAVQLATRGGSSGGHGGSGSSSSGHSSSSGSSSSGGRGVTAPRNSGGSGHSSSGGSSSSGHSSTSSGGRGVTSPRNSSGNSSLVSSGKVSVSKGTRASGGSYTTSNGYTYTYSTSTYHSYYTTYHGGYPAYGTSTYFMLLNDPYYGPNYFNSLSPWYGHAYPGGYYMASDHELLQNASTGMAGAWTVFLWIVGIIVFLAIIAFLVMVFRRRRSYGGDV